MNVIIPVDLKPLPTQNEYSVAEILANYFHADVYFVPRNNYKTPDFKINGRFWELKSPVGKGKYNLQHALRNASKQSENIILDARLSKIHMTRIINELKRQYKISRGIKRLLVIDKHGSVIDISEC
ncbi:hypothetical protein IJJ54_00995 [Candidatus Saccharibacteria bacterium]|nr:hypothetical protein [Candidatus Saccharibacteria bacterium]